VLNDLHATALVPHHQQWSGPKRDPYHKGRPLMVCSSDGAPFHLVTHVHNLGNVFIAGPSQTGKSGKLGIMNSQTHVYSGSRRAIFDRDFSLKAFTLLHGGQHYVLGGPDSARLQPLGALDTEAQRQSRAIWLEQVFIGEGVPPDPAERREIWRMLHLLAELPREARTMSMARRLLQVNKLRVGLTPFCAAGPDGQDGEYAFFDGNTDAFAWGARTICWEMSALVNKPRALEPALSYVFGELEAHWFLGDPVYITLDEAKWLLGITRFLGEIEIWLKARAKKNVSIWMALQELYDAARTDAWQAILANMPLRLLLPNPQAMSPRVRPFYEDMMVPEHVLRWLMMGQPMRDYVYWSPYGHRRYQCALSPVERLLCAASTQSELAVLDELAGKYGPEELPGMWLRYWGYPAEAALVSPPHVERLMKGEACSAIPLSSCSPVLSLG
jgi:type IV secretion system protein VirB4